MSLAARVVQQRLRAGEATRWVVRGSSMWPAIPDGSEVEVTPCAAADLREGDLVAYARRDEVIVHRLILRGPNALTLRGDSLDLADPPVPLADVLGRARVMRRSPLRWTRPSRPKALGAARAALAWLRRVAHPFTP